MQTDHSLGVTFHPLEVPGTSQCVLIDSFPRVVMIWTYWLSIGWTQAMQNIRWSFSLLNDKWAIRWGLSPNQQIETCFYSQICVIFSDWGDIKICWLPTTCPIHFEHVPLKFETYLTYHLPKMAHQKMIKSKVHPIDLKICHLAMPRKTTTVRKLLPETWGFLCPVPWTERLRGWGAEWKLYQKFPQKLFGGVKGSQI